MQPHTESQARRRRPDSMREAPAGVAAVGMLVAPSAVRGLHTAPHLHTRAESIAACMPTGCTASPCDLSLLCGSTAAKIPVAMNDNPLGRTPALMRQSARHPTRAMHGLCNVYASVPRDHEDSTQQSTGTPTLLKLHIVQYSVRYFCVLGSQLDTVRPQNNRRQSKRGHTVGAGRTRPHACASPAACARCAFPPRSCCSSRRPRRRPSSSCGGPPRCRRPRRRRRCGACCRATPTARTAPSCCRAACASRCPRSSCCGPSSGSSGTSLPGQRTPLPACSPPMPMPACTMPAGRFAHTAAAQWAHALDQNTHRELWTVTQKIIFVKCKQTAAQREVGRGTAHAVLGRLPVHRAGGCGARGFRCMHRLQDSATHSGGAQTRDSNTLSVSNKTRTCCHTPACRRSFKATATAQGAAGGGAR